MDLGSIFIKNWLNISFQVWQKTVWMNVNVACWRKPKKKFANAAKTHKKSSKTTHAELYKIWIYASLFLLLLVIFPRCFIMASQIRNSGPNFSFRLRKSSRVIKVTQSWKVKSSSENRRIELSSRSRSRSHWRSFASTRKGLKKYTRREFE